MAEKLKRWGIRLTPQRLAIAEVSRYDANLTPHANLVCVSCGTVVDTEVGQDMIERLRAELASKAEFDIASQRVDFYGWCPQCAISAEEFAVVQSPS